MEEAKQTMELTVGAVLEGKVKSITKYGAFIALPDNKTGMVHISEIANAFVSDIRQHLTEGQDVKVKIIKIEDGKINLSIKRLEENPAPQPRERRNDNHPSAPRRDFAPRPNQGQNRAPRNTPVQNAAPKSADQLFEEKLKAFMSESDSKISGIKQYSEHRTKSRRR